MYRIYDNEIDQTVFRGTIESYKKRILDFEYENKEDKELALELIEKNKEIEDLFHSLEFYGINIFGKDHKDLRIENLKSEVERVIDAVEEDIESSNYSLEVEWKSDCVELELIAYEKEKKSIYESVRIYDNGLWTGAGLLSWIRYHLDERFNLDELDAEAEELEEERE